MFKLLPKTLFLLSIIFCCLVCAAPNTYAHYFESKDFNKRVFFQDVFSKFPGIKLSDEKTKMFDYITLMSLNDCMSTLHKAARNANAQEVKPDDFDKKTIFVSSLVKQELKIVLKDVSNTELDRLFLAAHRLNIIPVRNAVIHLIAERMLEKRGPYVFVDNKNKFINRPELEANDFKLSSSVIKEDLTMSRYFKKYFKLAMCELEEKTFADYLALKGQPEGPELDVSEEGLTSLHGIELVQNPGQFTSISLKNNKLDSDFHPEFPKQPFRKFTNVEKINLSDNLFTTLPEDFLQRLRKLKEIDLCKNALTSLPARLLHGLNLEKICLEGNRLTTLPKDFFHDSEQLSTVDLSNNRFKELPKSIFVGVRKIFSIDVTGNNINLTVNQFVKRHSLKGLDIEIKI